MKEKTKIYWCANVFDEKIDWNILYYKPTFLYEEIKRKRSDISKKELSLFSCPAVKDLTSKIIVIKNTINSHYKFLKKNDLYEYKVLSKDHIGLHFEHKSNLENCMMFVYGMSFLMFTEENINMTFTSPYFSNSQHLKYGSLVPGKFNISKWFRSINFEFNLWSGVEEFKINKDEDMAYIHFDTTNEIELVRFYLTNEIKKIADAASTSSKWEKLIPLKERYDRFKRTQMNKLLIKEIKKNIIE